MCWNENISLNTFMFTAAVLLFIYYNNTYTQYKLSEFKSGYLYLFILSFILIQLVEYFLWKSIHTNNKLMNYIFSILGWVLIFILQPITALFVLPNKYNMLRNSLLCIYITIFIIIISIKQIYNPVQFVTTISKNGHLNWVWNKLYGYEFIIRILYFCCLATLFLSVPLLISLYAVVTLIYCYYSSGLTMGTVWCWFSNLILLYFLIMILFILPFKEYNNLC
jgi:hypothetical protein